MKPQPWGLYAIAVAIMAAGLLWAGVPGSSLLIAALAGDISLVQQHRVRR